MGVPLKDLLDPAAIARLKAAAGSGDGLEVKDDAPTGGMEHKADPGVGGAQVLEADAKTGRVTALVSVTGVEDRVKDTIEPGAYAKTLAEREPIGVWSHDDKTWVARTEHVEELLPGHPLLRDLKTMDGKPWPKEAGAVKVEALFNLDTPHGAAAFSDVNFFKGKTGWSIGYRATKAHRNPRTGSRSIKELDWYEYSPVMVGAASQPMTLSVKSLAQPVDADDPTGIAGEELIDELSPAELARFTELKASLGLEVKKRGNIQPVRDWYTAGAKGKIAWGTPGDLTRCHNIAEKYMTSEQAWGFCQLRHRNATGKWNPESGGRKADDAEIETKLAALFLPDELVVLDADLEEKAIALETKDRVRTAAGARAYGQPIGSVIRRDPIKTGSQVRYGNGRKAEVRAVDGDTATIIDHSTGRTFKRPLSDLTADGPSSSSSSSAGKESGSLKDLSDDDLFDELTKAGRIQNNDATLADRIRLAELSNERHRRAETGEGRFGKLKGKTRPILPSGSAATSAEAAAAAIAAMKSDQQGKPAAAKDPQAGVGTGPGTGRRSGAADAARASFAAAQARREAAKPDGDDAKLRAMTGTELMKHRDRFTSGSPEHRAAVAELTRRSREESNSPAVQARVAAGAAEADRIRNMDGAELNRAAGNTSNTRLREAAKRELARRHGPSGDPARVGGGRTRANDEAEQRFASERRDADKPAAGGGKRFDEGALARQYQVDKMSDAQLAEAAKKIAANFPAGDYRTAMENVIAAERRRRGGSDKKPMSELEDDIDPAVRKAVEDEGLAGLDPDGEDRRKFTDLADDLGVDRDDVVTAAGVIASENSEKPAAKPAAAAPAAPAGRKQPAGKVVNDPISGKPAYVSEKQGKLEYRHYPNGSVTILDTSKRSGTNKTVGHTGPRPDRVFTFDDAPAKPRRTARERDYAADSAGDATTAERTKLAALNRRRKARGQAPLLKLPRDVKSLDLAATLDDELDAYIDSDPFVEFGDPEQKAGHLSWADLVAEDLPSFALGVAVAVEAKEGLPLERAIPEALGRVRRWARGGGGVDAATVDAAQVALGAWEEAKAAAGVTYDSQLLDQLEQKAADRADAWNLLYDAGMLPGLEEKAIDTYDDAVLPDVTGDDEAEVDVSDLFAQGQQVKAAAAEVL